MSEKIREAWPDMMRGMLMLLVVIHHARFSQNVNVQQLYTPFFMCAFFFVSGCFFKGANMPFLAYVYKKMRELVIPYLVIGSVCYFVCSGYRESLAGGADYCHWESYCRDFLFIGSTYWFVCCLFVAQLIQYVIVRAVHDRNGAVLGLSAVVSLTCIGILTYAGNVTLPWYIHIACAMQWSMNLGYVLKKNHCLEKLNHGWIAALSGCIYLSVWGYACFVLRLPKISEGVYQHIGVYLLLVHTGIICCISLSQWLRPFSALLLIGRCTLCIYFTHFFVIEFFYYSVSKWYELLCQMVGMPQLMMLRGIIMRPSAVFASLLFGILISQLVKRWVPWLITARSLRK